ncbi:hypothetical protein CMV_010901 [Castanea mollissima]|uniref:Heat shock 70 kDa protein 16 n=1 Tax=Castanea mollissima TaxID=60419 RepID=A0A8J4VLE0_9ROSI|nr:hypothetical protein CMV_010901 [Castanea mollissima]
MSVVGFDIGNENCVIGVAKQRGIDVLLNDESKRETPAVVSFGEKQRFMGSIGAASATKNPRSTISQVKRLIGRRFREPDIENDLRLFPFECLEGQDGGVLIRLEYLGEMHTYSPVQILGMLFSHLKQIAEKDLELNVSDCVIGIPSYFTDLQRRAYLDAATIAGLRPLRLMHDCTATALGYGTWEGETLMRFCSDILQHSSRSKAPLNIECLMDEKDVKGFIKRDEFERLSLNLLDRISVPCHKALLDSGLTVEKIHSVELVGSGSRIPAITRILTSLFNREPSRTINASECVARGCALQCAMLSPLYRVREYEVQDAFPFSIGFSTKESPICTLSNSALFQKHRSFPSIKILCLHRIDTFHMEAYYADQNELPAGVSPKISSSMIGPFQVSNMEATKVKVRVQLNIHGIVTVVSASLLEDGVDDDSLAKSDDHLTSAKMEAEANHGSSAVPNSAEDSNLKRMKPSSISSGDGLRKSKFVKRLDIPVSECVFGGIAKAELSEAEKTEHQLVQQDLKMEHAKEMKNALESYVYEMRDKVLHTYCGFSTESEREGISYNLQQTEDWLYEDGFDESVDAYTEKLEYLKKLVDPIENRYKEEEARARASKDLLDCITNYRMVVESHPVGERDVVIDECNKAEQWLQEKLQHQNSLPKNADPILWSNEIKRKSEALDMTCKHIMRSNASPPSFEDEDDSDQRDKPDGIRMQQLKHSQKDKKGNCGVL